MDDFEPIKFGIVGAEKTGRSMGIGTSPLGLPPNGGGTMERILLVSLIIGSLAGCAASTAPPASATAVNVAEIIIPYKAD